MVKDGALQTTLNILNQYAVDFSAKKRPDTIISPLVVKSAVSVLFELSFNSDNYSKAIQKQYLHSLTPLLKDKNAKYHLARVLWNLNTCDAKYVNDILEDPAVKPLLDKIQEEFDAEAKEIGEEAVHDILMVTDFCSSAMMRIQ